MKRAPKWLEQFAAALPSVGLTKTEALDILERQRLQQEVDDLREQTELPLTEVTLWRGLVLDVHPTDGI